MQRLICAGLPLNVAYDGKYANVMPECGMLLRYSIVQRGFHEASTAGTDGVVVQCIQNMCAVDTEYLHVSIGHAPVCLCNVRHTSRVTLAFWAALSISTLEAKVA